MAGFFLLLVVLAGSAFSQPLSSPQCVAPLTPLQPAYDYEYYQTGDVLIGGLFSVHNTIERLEWRGGTLDLCAQLDVTQYKYLMAFFFAIDEINKDSRLLPNLTLGFHVFDPCGHPIKAVDFTLKILSGYRRNTPNYSATGGPEVAGFVGDAALLTTLAMADILNIYHHTQISHGVTDPLLSDRRKYPYFFRTIPGSWLWNKMVGKFLKLMGWTWVGIITSSDGPGEAELQELRKELSRFRICIEFVIYLTNKVEINRQKLRILEKATTDVVIACGYFLPEYIFFCQESEALRHRITLILNKSWNVVPYFDAGLRETWNCSLMPVYPPRYIVGLDVYMETTHPSKRPADPLLEDIWLKLFNCPSSNEGKNKIFQELDYLPNLTCTGTESIAHRFSWKFSPYFYFIYTTVYTLAHALNNMKTSTNTFGKYGLRQKLHRYVRTVDYSTTAREKVFFNERGELLSVLNLEKMIYLNVSKNKCDIRAENLATSLTLEKEKRKYFTGDLWKRGKCPVARCNDPCPPGYHKGPTGGIHTCCYRCVPCSDGEVSNVTDSDLCSKCPDDQRPDERRVICIPKTYEYLSYETNMVALIFHCTSVLCSAVTLYILTLFIIFRDTPIVKANNRTVSFILLASILLSFLCVFLFLGRPVDITCVLRQVSFGVFFSIAVSCVLAKTITVCIAFKASKPNSYWRKWVGEKTSNSVVIIGSSVQVLICVIWLSESPPYQEYDAHSYPEKIVIQCNEGSVIGFYSMLGYLGLLAAVSFFLAFMVRTLPDSFNEAKYITFSMLVFCSVWIAMIPTYLSTRGKYMVAVEIFAILTSSAGLLGCIFVPKCYLIIIKPEKNSRKYILEKVQSQPTL